MALKTYRGSCQCGAVQYEADLDLEAGTGRCNCRICTKIRNWSVMTKPEAVRVLAGGDALTEYAVGNGIGRHKFCRVCGVRPFMVGHLEQLGGDFAAVQVATLDLTPEEFVVLPVTCADGRNDNWWSAPALTNYL